MIEPKKAGVLSPRNRNISQSTGLAKFNLSPRKLQSPNSKEAYSGLQYQPPNTKHRSEADLERKASFNKARSVFDGSPVKNDDKVRTEQNTADSIGSRKPKLSSPFRPTFAVEKTENANSFKNNQTKEFSRTELLSKYASKQTQLLDIQKQKEILEFEILEIEAQLQKNIGQGNFADSVYAKASTEARTLKGKVSTFFESGPDSLSLKKTASTIFNIPTPNSENHKDTFSSFFSPKMGQANTPPTQFSSSLRKTASSIFTPPPNFAPNHELKKKASAMLNHKFVAEVREKIDQQQNEIEELTKKGTQFARNLLSSLSPKKETKVAYADTSLMFENVADISAIDRSVLLSEDEFEENSRFSNSSAIDIDDYDSDEENQEN